MRVRVEQDNVFQIFLETFSCQLVFPILNLSGFE